jgi:high-affinity Fe2+/Pb2+ permease
MEHPGDFPEPAHRIAGYDAGMLSVGKVLVSVGGILSGIASIGLTFFSVLASDPLEITLSAVSVVAGLAGGIATGLNRAWGAALVALACGAMAVVFVSWGPSSNTLAFLFVVGTVLAIAVAVGMWQAAE